MEETTGHVQEDIVIRPQARVIRYLHGQAFCTRCHRPVIQAGEGELLNAPIGPVAKSVAMYLRYRIGIPYRKTTELFRELFGLTFVPASALGFDRKAATRGAPIYEDLRDKIRNSDVVHADETSWRNDGVGHYVWFAGNPNLAFFHIDRHRSAEVAKSIFGEDFDGTLVRDRYAAYNGIGVDWQTCVAHILTKAKEIRGEHALLPQMEKDTATGRFIVIPQGSKLMGTYDSRVSTGQERVLVAWTRIVFPDASAIDLGRMPGSDEGGYGGFHDQVNEHFWKIWGNALLLSAFSSGIQLSQGNGNNQTGGLNATQTIAASTGQQMGQLGQEIARRNLQIQPTLEVRPGYRFVVQVTKDLILRRWAPKDKATAFIGGYPYREGVQR